MKELVECGECNNRGYVAIQLSDGEYQLSPCQCIELLSWYNVHGINISEEE